jgi:hypothetical protein
LLVAAVVIVIGGYQLLINKYYWGPKAAPKKMKDATKTIDKEL